MNLNTAQNLARRLMSQHGLGHLPLEFNGAKKTLGFCAIQKTDGKWKPVKISLSRHYVELLQEPEVRDVILHEIAHALTPGHQHDVVWRQMARRLGARPKPYVETSASPPPTVIGKCPNGHTSDKFRLPQRVSSCGRCSRTWKLEYAYTWYKNGEMVPFESMPAKYRAEFARVSA